MTKYTILWHYFQIKNTLNLKEIACLPNHLLHHELQLSAHAHVRVRPRLTGRKQALEQRKEIAVRPPQVGRFKSPEPLRVRLHCLNGIAYRLQQVASPGHIVVFRIPQVTFDASRKGHRGQANGQGAVMERANGFSINARLLLCGK